MRVAMFFVTDFEEVEALAVIDILRRGNVDVKMIGVNAKTVVGAHNIEVKMDSVLAEENLDEYDMLVLPGGPGTGHLKQSQTINDTLKKFKKQGKWIAAICAAPSVLGGLGILNGQKAICYPGYESQLTGAEIVNQKVVVSDKIITAKGPGAALAFGFKLLEIIKGKDISEKIRIGMIAD